MESKFSFKLLDKLITYIDLCECCMYGFPNDIWDKQRATSHREAYMKSAFGALDFVLKCCPEWRSNESITDCLEEKMFKLQEVVDSYFTSEDKKTMERKSYKELAQMLAMDG